MRCNQGDYAISRGSLSTIFVPPGTNFNQHNNNDVFVHQLNPHLNHSRSFHCYRQLDSHRYAPVQFGHPLQFHHSSRFIHAVPAVVPTPKPQPPSLSHYYRQPVWCYCCGSHDHRCLQPIQSVTVPSIRKTFLESPSAAAYGEKVISIEVNEHFTGWNCKAIDQPPRIDQGCHLLTSSFQTALNYPQIPPILSHKFDPSGDQCHQNTNSSDLHCSESSLTPSPKGLCIVLEDESVKEERCQSEKKAQSEEKVVEEKLLHFDSSLGSSSSSEHQVDTLDEGSFGLDTSEIVQDQLPFANFVGSPGGTPPPFLPEHLNDLHSDQDESSNVSGLPNFGHSFPVSIPLSLASPKSTTYLQNNSSLTTTSYIVSVPIDIWLKARRKSRRQLKVQKKILPLMQSEVESDEDDQQAVQTLEEVFRDSPLLSVNDIDIIKRFLKGERVVLGKDSIVRFALSKVVHSDNGAQYAAIELDLIRQLWRGIMVDASDLSTTVFYNEHSVHE